MFAVVPKSAAKVIILIVLRSRNHSFFLLATKKNNGEITTLAFAVNGNATLTFNAAAQEGDIVTLRNNNKVYDLQGREVKAPGKGVYIVNGKKVVLTNAR